jgi:hypothetical protein
MRPILPHIAVFAAILTAGAMLVGGPQVALGAAAGGAVAIANWLALRWVAHRIVNGTMGQRAAVTVVLCSKMGVLAVVSWALIVKWGLHPVGFLVGVTALVLGVFSGATASQRQIAEEKS